MGKQRWLIEGLNNIFGLLSKTTPKLGCFFYVGLNSITIARSFHSSLKMSPFQALYGRTPPTIPCYTRTSSSIQAVDDILTQRDQLLRTLKRNLQEAQQRMTCKANAHRRDFEFYVGDLVLLRLQPYCQSTITARHSHKLSKRFYGPFPVIACIGQVAYRLGLPKSSRIHPVFHISVLKPFCGAHSPPSSVVASTCCG